MINNWSSYQTDIFKDIETGNGHTVIEAVAGSGKTTTIVEALKYIPSTAKVLFVAFNKHISEALKTRVPTNVEATTLNSFGWRYGCLKQGKKISLDTRKTSFILRDILGSDDESIRKYIGAVQRLVSLGKAHLYTNETPKSEWIKLIDRFDIEIHNTANDSDDAEERVIELARQVMRHSIDRLSLMDFDDQIYMPVIKNWALPKYDFVFVDETQDLNYAQVQMILRLVNNTGRIFAVGDRYQSIYGFRGADVDAIPQIISTLKAKTLPLSITYRCPKSVVALAQEIVPTILAGDNAKEGNVSTIDDKQFLNDVKSGDKVLCRTTAPLVHYCLRLIGAGKKANVLGRDIGKGLIALIDKLTKGKDSMSALDMLEKLNQHEADVSSKLAVRNQESRLQKLMDDCETIALLSEDCRTVSDVKNRIESIFSDDVEGIMLSTVHRAKGLEAETVFILAPHLLPHPLAKQEWQRQQEMNLKYVAITRSLNNLIWVQTPKKLGAVKKG